MSRPQSILGRARRGTLWRTVTALAGAAAMVTATVALAPAASATGGTSSNGNTTPEYICHAPPGQHGDKYVKQSPDAEGILNGHFKKDKWDIIPPFTYEGKEYQQNWNETDRLIENGQAIWEKGCNIPGDQPEPSKAQVSLSKTWIDGKTWDSVVLTITGKGVFTPGYSTVKVSSKAATAEVEPGQTVRLTEVLASFSGTKYTTVLECSVNDGDYQSVSFTSFKKLNTNTATYTIPSDAETVDCVFTNTRKSTDEPNPTTVTVHKQWVINDDDPVADTNDDGMEPGTLTVTSSAAEMNAKWGEPITWTSDEVPTVTEEGQASIDREGCSVDEGYDVAYPESIEPGTNNTITVTNYVTCEEEPEPTTTVTVNKRWIIDGVEYNVPQGEGPALPTDFDAELGLDGVDIGEGDTPEWGQTYTVTDLDAFGYGETDMTYPDGCSIIEESVPASLAAASLSTDGQLIPGENNEFWIENNVQCTTLTLVKNVNSGSTDVWTLSATQLLDDESSEESASVRGTSGVTGYVPEGEYRLSESGPSGFDLTDLTCDNAEYEGANVYVEQGSHVTCTFTNTLTPGPGGGTPPPPVPGTPPPPEQQPLPEPEPEIEVGGISDEVEPQVEPEPVVEEVAVAGVAQEAPAAAPSAAAHTGETGSNTWAYLTLAAGLMMLLGAARIRRHHGA